jgi:hypothetical protein
MNWSSRNKHAWGSGGIVPPFLTSAQGGNEWSASRPCRFTPGETHSIEDWVGPGAGLDVMSHLKWLYFALVYFVNSFVSSLTACFASSAGNNNRTAVWTSRLVMVDLLLYWAGLEASAAIRSNMSLRKLFITFIALVLMSASGRTCFSNSLSACVSFSCHFSRYSSGPRQTLQEASLSNRTPSSNQHKLTITSCPYRESNVSSVEAVT